MAGAGAARRAIGYASARTFRSVDVPPVRFVVYGSGRTGSTLLGDLLGSHPEVVFGGELLAAAPTFARLRVDAQLRRAGSTAYGYRLLSSQLRQIAPRGSARWLAGYVAAGWRLVYIHRDDGLRHALSNVRARERQAFHLWDGEDAPAQGVRPVDTAAVRQWLATWREHRLLEREVLGTLDFLDVGYERDLEPPGGQQATADRVFGWLGLAPAPVGSSLRKLAPGTLRGSVANYDELAAALAGSEFARFLEP